MAVEHRRRPRCGLTEQCRDRGRQPRCRGAARLDRMQAGRRQTAADLAKSKARRPGHRPRCRSKRRDVVVPAGVEAWESLGIVFETNLFAPAAVIFYLQGRQHLKQCGANLSGTAGKKSSIRGSDSADPAPLHACSNTVAKAIDLAGIVGRHAFHPLGLLHNTISPAQMVRSIAAFVRWSG